MVAGMGQSRAQGAMIGSNSAPIIADAFITGALTRDVDILFEAILKNARVEEGRPVSSVGREGLEYYNRLGYVPYDVGINENAARTLEYAYADFTIARMAEKLGREEVAQQFYRKSLNYKNVFDPSAGWMRGRNEDGSFQSPFNPLKWGDAFTEGNSLHYTWSVFHDVQGLIDLMGGKDAFIGRLDTVFEMPPLFDDSYYGFTIHEIREMQLVNMGNYAHGNQPIQHMIYLYNYAGVPYKTQQLIRKVLTTLYSATPDGYCGDEDNGQTSAWYVFSALGFYPVAPATDQYVIGSPLFKRAIINLENGNQFNLSARQNTEANFYIQSALLNGEEYRNNYIRFEDIQRGGALIFQMADTANRAWGTLPENVPFSLSTSRE